MKVYWKPILNYPNYFVSCDGFVLSLRQKSAKILSTQPRADGYVQVNLRCKNNKVKRFCIHRLVADAFLSPKKGSFDVNHIDGNKANNSYLNLEWVTKSENTIHAYMNNLMKNNPPKGESHRSSKLTKDDVVYIRNVLLPAGYGIREISRMYNICHKSVTKIRDRITWKHI